MAFYSQCYSLLLIISMFLFLNEIAYASAQLTSNYYASTCPRALYTIRNVVNNAAIKEHRMGASLLRLHFHDCFVNVLSLSLACMHAPSKIDT